MAYGAEGTTPESTDAAADAMTMQMLLMTVALMLMHL